MVVFIFPIIKCASFQLITALLRQYSRKNGFAFDLHQIAKEDETSTTVAFGYDPRNSTSPIQFSSFHASKGLEWDIVAIINATDSIFELRDGEVESVEQHEQLKRCISLQTQIWVVVSDFLQDMERI